MLTLSQGVFSFSRSADKEVHKKPGGNIARTVLFSLRVYGDTAAGSFFEGAFLNPEESGM